jgi:hypothetical protein
MGGLTRETGGYKVMGHTFSNGSYKVTRSEVTLNTEQGLYVIPSNGGYSCLGFDVCKERTQGWAAWLGESLPEPIPFASLNAYKLYSEMLARVSERKFLRAISK